MNEFTRMIREALVGDEPHETRMDGAEVREALARIDKRDAWVRGMGWFAVLWWTAVGVLAGLRFFGAEPADTRAIVGWAMLVLVSFGGIGFGKMFIFLMQAHLGLQRDMKRIELQLAEGGAGHRSGT